MYKEETVSAEEILNKLSNKKNYYILLKSSGPPRKCLKICPYIYTKMFYIQRHIFKHFLGRPELFNKIYMYTTKYIMYFRI